MQFEDIDPTAWIGRTEKAADTVTPTPVRALTATLDHPAAPVPAGTPLPPLWHWLYFLPVHQQSEIGPDGHARRGGFLPPVELPRRMWAGSQFEFRSRSGSATRSCARRRSTTSPARSAAPGQLVFVKVRHEVRATARPTRRWSSSTTSSTGPSAARTRSSRRPPPAPTGAPWQREIVPDDVLLFRYSALTFNGHRIHYDRRYVTEVEGYPGLIVHGPLIATLLLDLVRRNAARRGGGDVPVPGGAPDVRPAPVPGQRRAAGSDGRRPSLGPGPRGLADHGRHRHPALTPTTRRRNDHATAHRPHRRHPGARDRRRRSRPANSPTSAPASSRSSVPAPATSPAATTPGSAAWPRTSSGPTGPRRA